jgi:hypothetical protein
MDQELLCTFIKVLKDGSAIIYYKNGTEETIPEYLVVKEY